MDRREFLRYVVVSGAGAAAGCRSNSPSPGRVVALPEMERAIVRQVSAVRKREGAGFLVRRPFPIAELDMFDPFVLLDEMGPETYGPGEALGAPDHPHRGFETVTYMLDGRLHHRDSMGHDGSIGAGGVQWMTAGSGIVHSEMPSDPILERGGRMHGFQLWINLPRAQKWMPPRYQELDTGSVPSIETQGGLATGRIVAGSALGVEARLTTTTPVTYQHWTLRSGADVDFPVPESQRVGIFVFEGSAALGSTRTQVDSGTLAILGEGEVVRMSNAGEAPVELLLLGGRPLEEPVARYGPFVMNTPEEIRQAFDDYRSGRMGRIPPRG